MFSTSMIASSTTSPIAITRPARTIVLIVAPHVDDHERRGDQRERDRHQADDGRPPVEQERRRGSTTTRPQPIHIASDRLSSDRSMNVAGRKIVGSTSTPFSAGLEVVERLLDVAGDFQGVARRLLLDDQEQAGAVVDHGVADRRREADLDLGDVAQPRAARRCGRRRCISARSSGVSIGERWRTAIRWLGVSTNPPAPTAEASVTALTTVSSVTPLVRSRSGSTSTWYCRVALAPDRDVRHAGDRHQPGADRPLRQERQVHLRERLRRHADLEQPAGRRQRREDHRLPAPPPGSRDASTESRSCTTCRGAIRSVPSLRIRTTDDSPSTDFDRIVFSPVVPFSAFSSGTLTRLSTSSVDSPGASVWTSTSGGANSGKTSSGACLRLLHADDHQHDRQRQHQHPEPQRRWRRASSS